MSYSCSGQYLIIPSITWASSHCVSYLMHISVAVGGRLFPERKMGVWTLKIVEDKVIAISSAFRKIFSVKVLSMSQECTNAECVRRDDLYSCSLWNYRLKGIERKNLYIWKHLL